MNKAMKEQPEYSSDGVDLTLIRWFLHSRRPSA